MKINLEVTDDMLVLAAAKVSGSPHPDDTDLVIETFREMITELERLSLGEGPEDGIDPHPED